MTYRQTILLTILFSPFLSNATSQIKQLEVQGETATFTLSAPKTHTIPSCVSNDNQNKWAINLNSLQGQAMYSLLVTAVSKGMEVDVTSANRCEALPNVEQAAYVALSVNQQVQKSQIPALYKSDGVTKLGNIVGSPAHHYYYYVPIEGAKIPKYYLASSANNPLFFLDAQCSGQPYINSHFPGNPPAYSQAIDLFVWQTNYLVDDNKLNIHGQAKVYELKGTWVNDGYQYECTDTGKVASEYPITASKVVPSPHYLCGESACIIK
ncbi:hypothetical protein [Pseudoalteromonas sp. S16_S37]|uniref:hypothetical protein n=1 Tax=Pseudoalteromonas sp. S16_S37 TaxID=2720228 RepID=UPI001680EDBF|nr:hypothetical protein [Pseudoalteromonas sp. S16_S37]MBD1582583.1 hypothetical protein [Pseudoalteromonas sp. S16_S37]